MTVSRELKAKRLALSTTEDKSVFGARVVSYEETFLYFYNHENLDMFYDGNHIEVTANDLSNPANKLKFTSLLYHFSETTSIYHVEDNENFYHNLKHGADGILRGEIFVGEIDFGSCWASPVIKYKKNLITGTYDFSQTEAEFLGVDCYTSSQITVSFTDDALLLLTNIMIEVINNGTPLIQSSYKHYQRTYTPPPIQDEDDICPF